MRIDTAMNLTNNEYVINPSSPDKDDAFSKIYNDKAEQKEEDVKYYDGYMRYKMMYERLLEQFASIGV